MFNFHSNAFTVFGISRNVSFCKNVNIKSYLYCVWVAAGITNVYFLFASMLLDLCCSTSDLLEFSSKISVITIVTDITFKLSFMVYKKAEFLDLMENLNSYSWNGLPVHDRETGDQTMFGCICLLDKYTAPYVLTTLSATVTISLFCAIKHTLIYETWYPFDLSSDYLFYLVLFSQIFASFILSLKVCVFNSFFAKIALMLCSQLEVLSDSLRSLKDQAVEPSSVQIAVYDSIIQRSFSYGEENQHREDQMMTRFSRDIEHHQKILRSMTTLRELYSPLFGVQFIIAVVDLCFTLFLSVTVSEYNIQYLLNFTILSQLVLQMCVYCWCGTLLTQKAQMICEAAYDCSWYNEKKGFRRCVLIMMIRASHVFALTAGNFATVSITTLMKIFQEAVSYLVVMLTLTAGSRNSKQYFNTTLLSGLTDVLEGKE